MSSLPWLQAARRHCEDLHAALQSQSANAVVDGVATIDDARFGPRFDATRLTGNQLGPLVEAALPRWAWLDAWRVVGPFPTEQAGPIATIVAITIVGTKAASARVKLGA